MSEKKKAFVFDTNFIIEYKKRLDEVVKNLSTDFNVYVTQVSIDERIAQNCREAKEKFDKVEECIKKYPDIADVTMRKSFEEVCASYQADTPKAYKKIVCLFKKENWALIITCLFFLILFIFSITMATIMSK